jgi:hypothetical protein
MKIIYIYCIKILRVLPNTITSVTKRFLHNTFITTAFCSSYVATAFVQLLQRVWQSQACPCPTQGVIIVNGCQGPKDRGEHSAPGES